MRIAIQTDNAPLPIGCYSQAVKAGQTVYLSGQIPLEPTTQTLRSGDLKSVVQQVFNNIKMVAGAAGGSMEDIVKLTIYLTNLADIAMVNEVIPEYFQSPYPARTTIQVAALPMNTSIEIEAIMVLSY